MKLISDDEIMGAVVEVDTPLGCNISIGAFPALKAVAQAQLEADLKDHQAERGRIVEKIRKIMRYESSTLTHFECYAPDLMRLQQEILEGEL